MTPHTNDSPIPKPEDQSDTINLPECRVPTPKPSGAWDRTDCLHYAARMEAALEFIGSRSSAEFRSDELGPAYDQLVRLAREACRTVPCEPPAPDVNPELDERLAPAGYRAVLSELQGCDGCAFHDDGMCHRRIRPCTPDERPDGLDVIFVPEP